MRDLLVGIDIGTGGCKITVIDNRGDIIYEGTKEIKAYKLRPGWEEQDPDDWYDSVGASLKQALLSGSFGPEEIRGIGIDASTHNAVLLDSDWEILRKSIMWTDQRSAKQAEFLSEKFGKEIYEITFHYPKPTWTLPQLLWVKNNEPVVFEQIRHVMFTKDYIVWKLTNNWSTDLTDGQGSLLVDMRERDWSKRMCDIASISPEVLPPIKNKTEIVGKVTDRASRETGLRSGIPVITGTSDTAAEYYSVGAIDPGDSVVKLATAGVVSVFDSQPHPTPISFTYTSVIPEIWYHCMGTNSAASSLKWYKDVFIGPSDNGRDRNIYAEIDKEASQVTPGSDGLIFHPYLMGERSPYWDPNLRASFTGISAYHSRGHFSRSIMEGVAFSIKDCMSSIEELGIPTNQVKMVGGGSKSKLWQKILAEVLGKPLTKLVSEDASFGSAMLAGVGTGVFGSLRAAVEQCVRIENEIVPDEKNVENYERCFGKYKSIHDNLEGIYREDQGSLV